jgi:hypothetical protein
MISRPCRAALLALAVAIAAPGAHAGAVDYVFEPVQAEIKSGGGSELAVRLIHKPTGQPVPDAVLFRTRLDMGPDGMANMTAELTAMPAQEPGVYRFKADLTMAGGWAFRIMAKVQGEAETVKGAVIFQAKE